MLVVPGLREGKLPGDGLMIEGIYLASVFLLRFGGFQRCHFLTFWYV